ncbi:hypothetical protein J3D55_003594 [Chryseobacterium ginsenosidimutans]|uniref:hypothetical protein n=1 Tax=Chryseobacterium ginsenosidimutans TaxID=687846 RepID=UPI002169B67F|nr:hypothetical protein [Chryseobacterium ginsenosidimutans]MCS3870678.1 hypothetical protein [Chryseobacterium ginsenosidimutans]
MKKIILLSFCFLFIFCSNQMKLNKGKDVDIIFPSKYIDTQSTEKVTEEIIKNNTNNTYIIDPFGFYGKSYVLENGKVLEPYLYFKNGYYTRNDALCREDLIILQPFQTIHHAISLNKNNRAIYRYTKSNKYEEIIKSFHNKYNATILGCDNYIMELESKGYKVLEDSIVTKIPLNP